MLVSGHAFHPVTRSVSSMRRQPAFSGHDVYDQIAQVGQTLVGKTGLIAELSDDLGTWRLERYPDRAGADYKLFLDDGASEFGALTILTYDSRGTYLPVPEVLPGGYDRSRHYLEQPDFAAKGITPQKVLEVLQQMLQEAPSTVRVHSS